VSRGGSETESTVVDILDKSGSKRDSTVEKL